MLLTEPSAAELQAAWAAVLGEPVASIVPCLGGRNHRVEQLTGASGRRAVVKRDLVQGADDGRRRVEVEFSSVQFLWRHGLRCIPQPLGADPAQGWAMYEWIDGSTLSADAVRDDDIDQAVQFAGELKRLRSAHDSRHLPPASEACLSVEELLAAIRKRLARLQEVSDDAPLTADLRAFLSTACQPHLARVVARCDRTLAAEGMSRASRLAPAAWTLSPSDFGFHNAVKRRDGRLVFLDLEYFGWDDPAKMIDDFVLHPGMSLSEPQVRRALAGFFRCFEEDAQVARRAEVLWPLCGLNWCLIFLNEFVPTWWRRRGFASGEALPRRDVLLGQLAKAQHMLRKVVTDDGRLFRAA